MNYGIRRTANWAPLAAAVFLGYEENLAGEDYLARRWLGPPRGGPDLPPPIALSPPRPFDSIALNSLHYTITDARAAREEDLRQSSLAVHFALLIVNRAIVARALCRGPDRAFVATKSCVSGVFTSEVAATH